MPDTTTHVPAGRREWTALAVVAMPLLLVSMDASILFFAVPHIAASLGASGTQTLWILDVYGFVLSGLLLTMGSVADRVGPRRLLLLGAGGFGGASLLAAYAPTPGWLIAARALLGIAGSTLMPSTLALIRRIFHDEAQRTKAVAIWAAVLAGGVGIGPVVCGLLLERFWWGAVFLVNLPLMVILLVVGPRLLPEAEGRSGRVDAVSSILSLAAILPAVHVLKEGAGRSWTPALFGYAALSAVCAVLFVRRQRRLSSPLVDLGLLRGNGVGVTVLIQVIAMFALLGNALLMTQYLQSVLGYSALTAALWSLLPSVVVGGAAPAAAAATVRWGRPIVMAVGLTLAAAGFLLLWRAGVSSSIMPVLCAGTIIASGLVSVTALVTDHAVALAPASRAGATGALVETASELGGALGLAVLGSALSLVFTARMADGLPTGLSAGEAAAAGDSLAGALAVAARLPGDAARSLTEPARTAYVDGMHAAGLVAVVALLIGAAFALRLRTERCQTSPVR